MIPSIQGPFLDLDPIGQMTNAHLACTDVSDFKPAAHFDTVDRRRVGHPHGRRGRSITRRAAGKHCRCRTQDLFHDLPGIRGRGPESRMAALNDSNDQRPRDAPRPTGFLSCAALARLIPALGACAGQPPPLLGVGSARCGLPCFGALSFLSIATSLDQRMAAAQCRSNPVSIGHIRENSP